MSHMLSGHNYVKRQKTPNEIANEWNQEQTEQLIAFFTEIRTTMHKAHQLTRLKNIVLDPIQEKSKHNVASEIVLRHVTKYEKKQEKEQEGKKQQEEEVEEDTSLDTSVIQKGGHTIGIDIMSHSSPSELYHDNNNGVSTSKPFKSQNMLQQRALASSTYSTNFPSKNKTFSMKTGYFF